MTSIDDVSTFAIVPRRTNAGEVRFPARMPPRPPGEITGSVKPGAGEVSRPSIEYGRGLEADWVDAVFTTAAGETVHIDFKHRPLDPGIYLPNGQWAAGHRFPTGLVIDLFA